MEFQKVVGTDDEGERRCRIKRLEGVDGVDGERYSGPLDLDVADLKIRVSLDSKLSHPQAIRRRRNRPLLSVWRSRRGDDENGVQPFLIAAASIGYVLPALGGV